MASKNSAVIIGVPLDLGAKNLGVDVGPDAFRYQKMSEKLTDTGLTVTDLGNVEVTHRDQLEPGDSHARYQSEIIRVSEEVAEKVDQAVTEGQKVVALGGDHSLNLGVVAGASAAVQGDIGLLYFDAHGDMNTPETTLTGNIHGMHLAALMGFGPDALVNVHRTGVKLPKQNLLHIGGCDFDQAELDLVERENLQAFSMFDLLSGGLAPLLQKIDDLMGRVSNIWISLDLDSIDAIYAPGAGMPNRRGLSYREIVTIAEYIGKKGQVIGVDVAEYNPLQDIDHKTAELGIELVAKFLGKDYSWYTNYLARNDLTN